jgi:uncharacterized SAM-binding protein YcdF (DUF218 family)
VRTAIVVLGHGGLDADGVHRISDRCRLLVREAERLAELVEPDVVVFTGWSAVGGSSEAEQMRDAWRGRDVELVVEPTARYTAENASRTLPLLLERGVRRAVVVCAPLHLVRTRILFGRLYRDRGVSTRFRVARIPPSLHAVAWELGALPLVPRQLRAARAELDRQPR